MDNVTIFVPKETNDSRVALTPSTVRELTKNATVLVEKGAGIAANYTDKEYKENEAKVSSADDIKKANIVVSLNPPAKKQLSKIKEGTCWVSLLLPQSELETIKEMIKKKMTAFSLNLIPRISRAQKMDALSSQSNLAGYKAVLLAANHLAKAFPLQMTAAGTLQPAKVLVMGAGVAGLSAIATAKRLGAVVEASDVRLAAKEQVESLGAKFVDVPVKENGEDKEGYAKEASKEFMKKQAEEVNKRLKTADIVITTALIPGRKAPVLITKKQVSEMKPGSVIVDMATIQGGNCEVSEQDKTVVKESVTIIGESNIPSTIPQHASDVYAKNIQNFITDLIKDKKVAIPKEDEIYEQSLLLKNGIVQNKIVSALLGDQK